VLLRSCAVTITIDTGERDDFGKRVHFVEVWICGRRFVSDDMQSRGEALRAAAETARALKLNTTVQERG
jgi:hypothetical protein